ncbi:MAG: hypothetical protein ACXWKP_02705 [Bradyrhizobium sp.]
MGHGVIAAQQGGGAPYADRSGLYHRPNLIAILPPRSFIGSQGRFARLVPRQVERPNSAGHGEKRDTRPDQIFSRLQRGQGGRDGDEDDTCKQRTGSFEERINQRRANGWRYLLVRFCWVIRQLHRALASFAGEVLLAAHEAFLREHRYRAVVFNPEKRESAR